MAHITHVDTMYDLKGNYGMLKDAVFHNITVNFENEDGTHGQTILPQNRQGSVYRMDLKDIAIRMGDAKARGCWLQFQAVPTCLADGKPGYQVQDLIEGIQHAGSF